MPARRSHLRQVRAAAALLVLAGGLLAVGCGSSPAPDAGPEPDAWVTIRDARVATEVVRTFEEKARGLGGRDSLAWGHGMLFPYEQPGFLAFWMKDMRFSIDIVWIRAGRIIEIAHRVPWSPEGPGPTLRPNELADAVLEVPAGYAESHGWRRGDAVVIRENTGP
jgi:uncharacterized membrane protein (UPF0127 family)